MRCYLCDKEDDVLFPLLKETSCRPSVTVTAYVCRECFKASLQKED